MGETLCWAQNCLRIFKLRKSVNGKEPFRPKAPFTWPQPRRAREGKKQARPGSHYNTLEKDPKKPGQERVKGLCQQQPHKGTANLPRFKVSATFCRLCPTYSILKVPVTLAKP